MAAGCIIPGLTLDYSLPETVGNVLGLPRYGAKLLADSGHHRTFQRFIVCFELSRLLTVHRRAYFSVGVTASIEKTCSKLVGHAFGLRPVYV